MSRTIIIERPRRDLLRDAGFSVEHPENALFKITGSAAAVEKAVAALGLTTLGGAAPVDPAFDALAFVLVLAPEGHLGRATPEQAAALDEAMRA